MILVNTCAIRDHAEQRVLGRVGQLQQYREAPPGAGDRRHRVHGAADGRGAAGQGGRGGPGDGPRRLPAAARGAPLARGTRRRRPRPRRAWRSRCSGGAGEGGLTVLDFDPFENYEGVAPRRTSAVSAWVPVQRGLQLPLHLLHRPLRARRREEPRPASRSSPRCGRWRRTGVPEVTLLGQTVNSYEHGDWDFPRLLREVARVEGIRRVRFTSPHPNDFTRELVEVMAEEPTVCKQLHLPVQSGHDRTLKRMLRRYTVERVPGEDRVGARGDPRRSRSPPTSSWPSRGRRRRSTRPRSS